MRPCLVRRSTAPLALSLPLALGLGCGLINPNIFDTEIRLSRQDYAYDFGKPQAPPADRLPQVACSDAVDPCQRLSDQLRESQAQAHCDTARKQCYAEATVTLSYPVTLAQDKSFQSSVGQKAVSLVQKIEIDYGAVNTLTFDLPELTLYTGPQDAKNRTDPGVVEVGRFAALPAGKSVSDNAPLHITVERGSPAFTALERNIKNPGVPFVFLISGTPRIDAGQPTPAGKIELHLLPRFTVGLPRS